MMNHHRLLSLLVGCFLIMASLALTGCGSSPESLADDMCDCLSDKGMMACASLSQEHMEQLSGDQEGIVAYRQALAECE
jgi:uncharacterized protein YcfL